MANDVEMEFAEAQEKFKVTQIERELSKASKRNLKKKAVRATIRALKTSKRPKPSFAILPSSIELPKTPALQTFDEESLLTEIKRRTLDKNSRSVRIMPIPKNCPPLLLQDLCPTSIAVRIPAKKNCRYAFVEFKTANEARAIVNEVNGKILDGKPVRAFVCEEKPSNCAWRSLKDRSLQDFDLTSLFISNLPRFAERTELAQIFRTADKINFKNLPDGTCKGFCILKYRDQKQALEAFISRHETLYKGVPIFVNFQIKTKTGNTIGQKIEPTIEHAEKMIRSSKISEDDDERATHVKVSPPLKKRRLENGSAEIMNESGNSGKKMQVVKKTREAKNKKAEVGGDAEFSIHKKQNGEPQEITLLPYQLTRKKRLQKAKTKPAEK